MYTAAEIAAMSIPGLPSTKANVIARAAREHWHYEEQKGVGGTRRVYEIPARYTGGDDSEVAPAETKVAGAIAAGSSQVDTKKLELAMRALAEWETERGVKVDDERRPAVIAVLYDYLQSGKEDQVEVLLRALG